MRESTKRFYAQEMRRRPTPSEEALYSALLSALAPFDASVKCQEAVSYYIADFMIYPARVVVEVDGSYHATAKARAYDARRDSAMKALGIKVLRFRNDDVLGNTQAVCSKILEACGELKPRRASEQIAITHCPPARAHRDRPKKSPIDRAAFYSKFGR